MKQEELDNIFSYHSPKGDQPERYVKIRDAGKALAQTILDCTPGCADQTAAIRKVREAVMTANAAIAINEVIEEYDPALTPEQNVEKILGRPMK